MNEREYIIILEGIDRTAQITSIKKLPTEYSITFSDSDQPQKYSLNHVSIELVMQYSEHCENILLMANGTVIPADKILKSKNFIKIQSGEEKLLYKTHQVKMIPCKRKINNIKGKLVYLDRYPVDTVKAIYDFGEYFRVVFEDGPSIVSHETKIRVDEKCPETAELVYFGQIAGLHDDGKPNAAFSKKQYDQLRYINSDSVLNFYLKDVPPILTAARSKIEQTCLYPFCFNLSQKLAVENALSNNMSIVETPPGTGKTQTILNMIANILIQNQTVAIVSNSPAAIRDVQDQLMNDNYFFTTALLGDQSSCEAFFSRQWDYPEEMLQWQRTEEEQKKLRDKIQKLRRGMRWLLELQNEKAQLQQELLAYTTEKTHYEAYMENRNCELIEGLSFYHLSHNKIISLLADNSLIFSKKETLSLLSKFTLFLKYGFYDFSSLVEKNLDVVLQFQRNFYDSKIDSLNEKIKRVDAQLVSTDFNYKELDCARRSKTLFEAKLFERYQDKLENRPVFDKNTYREEFSSFIKEYPVILSTPSALRNYIAQDYMFDYLIIDEASQVGLAEAALSLSCCRNAVIVGDLHQLPYVIEPELIEKYESLFRDFTIKEIYDCSQHSILSSMGALFGKSISRTLLKEHYRCHPKIIQYCNRKYYGGELIPLRQSKAEDLPLVIVTGEQGNPMRAITNREEETYEIREIESVAGELARSGRIPGEKADTIGSEIPFGKQEGYRYQGRAKEMMIFSTVPDRTHQGKEKPAFVDDPYLVNHAVSRAMNQLVLITNEETFKNHGTNIGDLVRYVEYQLVDADLNRSEINSIYDLLYSKYSKKLIEVKSKRMTKKYLAECLLNGMIEKVLEEEELRSLKHVHSVRFSILLWNYDKLDEEERQYAEHPLSSVDFIIYNQYDNSPVLAIQTDGYDSKKKHLKMQEDEIKGRILKKYQIELLRIDTSESLEGIKLRRKLKEIMNNPMGGENDQ